jgi:formamidopyrimidine-DNA glycosylase
VIAGRLRKPAGAKLPGKIGLAAFDFSSGTLVLTEAGTKASRSLYLVRGGAGSASTIRAGSRCSTPTPRRSMPR